MPHSPPQHHGAAWSHKRSKHEVRARRGGERRHCTATAAPAIWFSVTPGSALEAMAACMLVEHISPALRISASSLEDFGQRMARMTPLISTIHTPATEREENNFLASPGVVLSLSSCQPTQLGFNWRTLLLMCKIGSSPSLYDRLSWSGTWMKAFVTSSLRDKINSLSWDTTRACPRGGLECWTLKASKCLAYLEQWQCPNSTQKGKHGKLGL